MDEDGIFISFTAILFVCVLCAGTGFTVCSLVDYVNYGQSYDDAEYDYLKSNVNLTRMVMDHKYCDRVSELYKDELAYTDVDMFDRLETEPIDYDSLEHIVISASTGEMYHYKVVNTTLNNSQKDLVNAGMFWV